MIHTKQNRDSTIRKTCLLWLWRFTLHALYNQFAWAYDIAAWLASWGRWQAWGRTAIPYLKGSRILELGHGPGYLLLDLYKAKLDPVGIDLSPAMSQQAKRRLIIRKAQQKLVRGRAQHLGFASGVFDSVVSAFPSDYILDQSTLQEIHRVLSPEGTVVLVPMAQRIGRGRSPKPDQAILQAERHIYHSNFYQNLLKAGFSSKIRWVDMSSSRVLVIIMQKYCPIRC